MPAVDVDGARALDIRARLVQLPANVNGAWILDRYGATLWDMELIGVIEAAIEDFNKPPEER